MLLSVSQLLGSNSKNNSNNNYDNSNNDNPHLLISYHVPVSVLGDRGMKVDATRFYS